MKTSPARLLCCLLGAAALGGVAGDDSPWGLLKQPWNQLNYTMATVDNALPQFGLPKLTDILRGGLTRKRRMTFQPLEELMKGGGAQGQHSGGFKVGPSGGEAAESGMFGLVTPDLPSVGKMGVTGALGGAFSWARGDGGLLSDTIIRHGESDLEKQESAIDGDSSSGISEREENHGDTTQGVDGSPSEEHDTAFIGRGGGESPSNSERFPAERMRGGQPGRQEMPAFGRGRGGNRPNVGGTGGGQTSGQDMPHFDGGAWGPGGHRHNVRGASEAGAVGRGQSWGRGGNQPDLGFTTKSIMRGEQYQENDMATLARRREENRPNHWGDDHHAYGMGSSHTDQRQRPHFRGGAWGQERDRQNVRGTSQRGGMGSDQPGGQYMPVLGRGARGREENQPGAGGLQVGDDKKDFSSGPGLQLSGPAGRISPEDGWGSPDDSGALQGLPIRNVLPQDMGVKGKATLNTQVSLERDGDRIQVAPNFDRQSTTQRSSVTTAVENY